MSLVTELIFHLSSPDQILADANFFDLFFNSPGTAHGYCLLWNPWLIGMQVVADSLIAIAYFSIPLVLSLYARRRPKTLHRFVLWLFSAFIIACGITHVMHIWTFWHPDYGVEAFFKLVTALVSVITAVVLWPLLPKVLSLPSREEMECLNSELFAENRQRQKAERDLVELNSSLEQRVLACTKELSEMNTKYRAEVENSQHAIQICLRRDARRRVLDVSF